ncbi:MAG: DNA N-6-adenine-methyltransferase [Acetobacteraceae bacterium]
MTAGRRNDTSLSHHWCTPPKYVSVIRAFFGGSITLDPCSNSHSIVKAEKEYSLPHHDGLAEPWDSPSIFVNPPYGADRQRGTKIKDWLRKCAASHEKFGAEVLALIPVATNTSHWKLYVWGAASAVAFLYDTRLRFLVNGADVGKGAPMSCAMVYWGGRVAEFKDAFGRFGAVVELGDLHGHRAAASEPRTLFSYTTPKAREAAE